MGKIDPVVASLAINKPALQYFPLTMSLHELFQERIICAKKQLVAQKSKELIECSSWQLKQV